MCKQQSWYGEKWQIDACKLCFTTLPKFNSQIVQLEKWMVQWETIYTLTVGGQFRLFPDLHFFRVGNLCGLDRMMGTFNMLQVAKL